VNSSFRRQVYDQVLAIRTGGNGARQTTTVCRSLNSWLENILEGVPYAPGRATRLNRPIVTRAHAPRQVVQNKEDLTRKLQEIADGAPRPSPVQARPSPVQAHPVSRPPPARPARASWHPEDTHPPSAPRTACAVGTSALAPRLRSGAAPGLTCDLEVLRPTVRARPGRLSDLSVYHSESCLDGAFARARRTLNRPNRRCSARAGGRDPAARGRAGPARPHRRSAPPRTLIMPDSRPHPVPLVAEMAVRFSLV
jgi:hypothetical protein